MPAHILRRLGLITLAKYHADMSDLYARCREQAEEIAELRAKLLQSKRDRLRRPWSERGGSGMA